MTWSHKYFTGGCRKDLCAEEEGSLAAKDHPATELLTLGNMGHLDLTKLKKQEGEILRALVEGLWNCFLALFFCLKLSFLEFWKIVWISFCFECENWHFGFEGVAFVHLLMMRIMFFWEIMTEFFLVRYYFCSYAHICLFGSNKILISLYYFF